ncbi:MAG: VOC family protein [bacterium]|nr:VOC family protein [bacterium]
MSVRPFHLALPAKNIEETIAFYTDVLGAKIGRSDETWVDFDLFGHQLVFHYCGGDTLPERFNPVDKHQVPIPHFGVILSVSDFEILAERIRAKGMSFIIAPYVRFKGTNGEQHTMFFQDNNGFNLEFKAFEDDRFIFEPFA